MSADEMLEVFMGLKQNGGNNKAVDTQGREG